MVCLGYFVTTRVWGAGGHRHRGARSAARSRILLHTSLQAFTYFSFTISLCGEMWVCEIYYYLRYSKDWYFNAIFIVAIDK